VRYALVNPVRNEAENLPRLAESVLQQTLPATRWIIVDDSSEDATLEIAYALAAEHPWIRVVSRTGGGALARGGPVVRSFHAGLDALDEDVDVVVKLDADVTLAPDCMERLADAFAKDPRLGIASGTCFDEAAGRDLFPTGDHVWGMARAYRSGCLADVLPLEERMGWDGVDEFKAHVFGWRTGVVDEARFCHHRQEGERAGSRWVALERQGDVAWFLCYRPLYLVARAAYQGVREPAAVGMVVGYVRAAVRRTPRLSDEAVVDRIRSEQRLRRLPRRFAEVIGRA
jgi:glycosyltransferase involved in cell wall biosynthesis